MFSGARCLLVAVCLCVARCLCVTDCRVMHGVCCLSVFVGLLVCVDCCVLFVVRRVLVVGRVVSLAVRGLSGIM